MSSVALQTMSSPPLGQVQPLQAPPTCPPPMGMGPAMGTMGTVPPMGMPGSLPGPPPPSSGTLQQLPGLCGPQELLHQQGAECWDLLTRSLPVEHYSRENEKYFLGRATKNNFNCIQLKFCGSVALFLQRGLCGIDWQHLCRLWPVSAVGGATEHLWRCKKRK